MSEGLSKHIIEQFVEGNIKSFELIFEDLYASMLGYAKTFLHNPDDSEDTVQEAFVELWNHRQKFENYTQIRAFLYLTIKNRCLNLKKHLQVVDKYKSTHANEPEVNFDAATIRTELVYELKTAIRKLPGQRKKIMLLSLQGFKNQEIADFLEISVNTVKQQKKIAYKSLKENLGNSSVLFLHLLFFSV